MEGFPSLSKCIKVRGGAAGLSSFASPAFDTTASRARLRRARGGRGAPSAANEVVVVASIIRCHRNCRVKNLKREIEEPK
jgi:hypothetical protein